MTASDMDLTPTAEQTALAAELRKVLDVRASSAALRRAVEHAGGFDGDLWQMATADLGWAALTVPEAAGGVGLGPADMVLLLEEAGRRLTPIPLWSTVALAVPLLAALRAPAADRCLNALATGAATVTVALPDPFAPTPWLNGTVRAESTEGGWRLSGTIPVVIDAHHRIIVSAPVDGGTGLFLVDSSTEGVAREPLPALDPTRPLTRVALSGALAERLDGGGATSDACTAALRHGRLGLAAETIGAAAGCLDLTRAYIAERRQFGRTIASFQAIKHRVAALFAALAEARALVHGAAAALAAGADDADLIIDAAGILADRVLWQAAEEAIQLHGGVGNTYDYDPHFYLRRAQAGSRLFGASSVRLARLADSLISTSHRSGQPADLSAFRADVADWMAGHLTGRFAALKGRGHAGDGDALPDLRKDWEAELAAGGWTCPGWPADQGGRALAIAEQVAFQEEYARAGGPGRLGHIGEGLIGPTLIAFGTDDQKRRHLPGIRAGTTFWAQGYSEPDAGSDLANIRTRARRDPATGDWLVSGQKVWTSLAHLSDWIFVLARAEEGSAGRTGLVFLLLPLAQPGITLHPIRQIGGGAEFNAVFLDNARARADDLVGAPGDGWKIAMALLGFERGVSTLGQQMGFSEELELILDTARRNGAAADPAIRQRIALAYAGLKAMRFMALRMLADTPTPEIATESLAYKYQWSNWHRDLGRLAMDVLGTDGLIADDDPLRQRLRKLFFFSRADTVYGGTNEIQLNIIAERGLGMPREPRG